MKSKLVEKLAIASLLLCCVRCHLLKVSIDENVKAFSKTLSSSRDDASSELDPEVEMNVTQLIESKGIACEQHDVITDDGFVLGLQRLARPNSTKPNPVLIVHGLLSSSDGFVWNLRNESLAFVLYDAGYDVWLGNVRGNKYSRRHRTLDPDRDPQFWQWTWDEMGRFDVPAMIDHVIAVSKKRQVDYIGHSQGTVVLISAFLQNSTKLAVQVRNFIALAPAAYVPHMTAPLRFLAPLAEKIRPPDQEFGTATPKFEHIMALLCRLSQKVCEDLVGAVGGYDAINTNVTRLPVYASHDPSGSSMRNMLHWSQMITQQSDEVNLSYYDYPSPDENMRHYNSTTPPDYPLSRFFLPTHVFCGSADTLVVLEDCLALTRALPNVRQVKKLEGYTHASFIYAYNQQQTLLNPILEILEE